MMKVPTVEQLTARVLEILEDGGIDGPTEAASIAADLAADVQASFDEAIQNVAELATELESELIFDLENHGLDDGSAADVVASCRNPIKEAVLHSILVEMLSANGFDNLARVYMRAKR